MAAMRELELLRLANNRLRQLPLWKAAAQRLRPIRPPARPTSARASSRRPPTSASLGHLADVFWLAGHTGRVSHIGAYPSGYTRCPA